MRIAKYVTPLASSILTNRGRIWPVNLSLSTLVFDHSVVALARLLVYHIKGKSWYKGKLSRSYRRINRLSVVLKEQASRRSGNRLESLQ